MLTPNLVHLARVTCERDLVKGFRKSYWYWSISITNLDADSDIHNFRSTVLSNTWRRYGTGSLSQGLRATCLGVPDLDKMRHWEAFQVSAKSKTLLYLVVIAPRGFSAARGIRPLLNPFSYIYVTTSFDNLYAPLNVCSLYDKAKHTQERFSCRTFYYEIFGCNLPYGLTTGAFISKLISRV